LPEVTVKTKKVLRQDGRAESGTYMNLGSSEYEARGIVQLEGSAINITKLLDSDITISVNSIARFSAQWDL
jgi:hypothetical protein